MTTSAVTTPTLTTTAMTTPEVTTTTASETSASQVTKAVLVLSTYQSSNQPLVIDFNGKFGRILKNTEFVIKYKHDSELETFRECQ